jgi:membrane protein required for colicin V production
MIDAHLNYFDMVVIGIMLLSCVFAFFRGFVKEILSLFAWVGAGFVTVKFFPSVASMLQPHFTKPIIAAVCATFILYMGSLIVFAIINRFIIKILKSGSEIGMLDNILGLAFGALRGALIISLGFLMLSLAISEENRPEWLQKAVTLPYVEKGAILLTQIAPAYLDELSHLQKKAAGRVQDSSIKEAGEDVSDKVGNMLHNGRLNKEIDDTKKDTSENFEQILKNLGKKP